MRVTMVLAATLALGHGLAAQAPEPWPLPEYVQFGRAASPADSIAIERLMDDFNQAWAAEDVDRLMDFYTADVEWTNAFGAVQRGHEELRDWLSALFARFSTSVATGESSRGGRLSTRHLGSDVVVLHRVTESGRGESATGEGLRRVHLTYVLARTASGWKIAHQMIMDAR